MYVNGRGGRDGDVVIRLLQFLIGWGIVVSIAYMVWKNL
jgi:hypothetical protein